MKKLVSGVMIGLITSTVALSARAEPVKNPQAPATSTEMTPGHKMAPTQHDGQAKHKGHGHQQANKQDKSKHKTPPQGQMKPEHKLPPQGSTQPDNRLPPQN